MDGGVGLHRTQLLKIETIRGGAVPGHRLAWFQEWDHPRVLFWYSVLIRVLQIIEPGLEQIQQCA